MNKLDEQRCSLRVDASAPEDEDAENRVERLELVDDASQSTAPVTPIHPEEMKATYELRIGKIVTLQASARITPAGVITTGIAISLLALSFGYLISSLRPRDRR